MIDWHCHILPGVDDGSPDMEHSLSMANLLAAAGFSDVYCTPHLIRGCFETSNEQVRQGVAELQERLNVAGIPLKLWPGREYCLDEYLLTYLADPLPLGDSRLLLVEIPPRITADIVRRLVYGLVRTGLTPVIAHPERCHLLEFAPTGVVGSGLLNTIKNLVAGGDRKPRGDQPGTTGNPLIDYLRDLGCSFQGNLGSLKGFYGPQVRRVAEAFVTAGVYDRYGTDLHSPEHAGMIL